MKKKFCLLIFTLLILFYSFSPSVFAATSSPAHELLNYEVKVNPQEDKTLNVNYTLKWKILKAEKPISWIKLELLDTNIDNLKGISDNISEIRVFTENNKSYIRIDFKQEYSKGDTFTIQYSLSQTDSNYDYEFEELLQYSFTIGGFSDIKIDEFTLLWNSKNVFETSATKINSDGYYVWTSNLEPNEKYNIVVKYTESSINEVNGTTEISEENTESEEDIPPIVTVFLTLIIIIVGVAACIIVLTLLGFI